MLKYKSCCEEPSNASIASSFGASKDLQNNLMTSLGDVDSPAFTTLNRIHDPKIREVIIHMYLFPFLILFLIFIYISLYIFPNSNYQTITLMTQHSASRRMPVKVYRTNLEAEKVFPKYFETTLYDLFLKIHWRGATPDDRIGIICQVLKKIIIIFIIIIIHLISIRVIQK